MAADHSSEDSLPIDFGAIFRVIGNADGIAAIEMRNGNIGTSTDLALAEAKPGDVFQISDDGLEQLPAELWPAGDRIGLIVWTSDTDVLVRSSSGMRRFPQRADNAFIKGQTIRLGLDGHPLAVITDDHIDEQGLEDDFDPQQLVVDLKGESLDLADFGGSEGLVRRALDLTSVALSDERPLEKIGVKRIKGMLFRGPTGTGKTFLAKCLAVRFGAKFYNISGPAIVDKYLGQSERRLRDIFEHANAHGPAILFFDEIDSLYTQRGESNHEATNRLVGQFLALLDGFTRFDDVFIIATTNLPGALDDALMRPGRLGHKLQFTTPSEHDRVRILEAGKRGVQFTSSPNLAAIAKKTEGWSAADLAAIWTEAGIAAAIDGRLSIADDDIDIGIEAVARDRTHERKTS